MNGSEFPVRVLLFGHLRELMGVSELSVTLASGSVVGELVERVVRDSPLEALSSGMLAISVNRRYVRSDHALRPGDEVALIPPVAGG